MYFVRGSSFRSIAVYVMHGDDGGKAKYMYLHKVASEGKGEERVKELRKAVSERNNDPHICIFIV